MMDFILLYNYLLKNNLAPNFTIGVCGSMYVYIIESIQQILLFYSDSIYKQETTIAAGNG